MSHEPAAASGLPPEWVPRSPRDISLPGPGEVHLWSASLDLATPRLDQLRRSLDGGELERAQRLLRAEDRQRWTAARGLLREILASYLRREADEIRFAYGPHHKPCLADPVPDLRFNLAHSGNRLVVALTTGEEIGVDVERWRPVQSAVDIAQQFFSVAERRALERLPETDQSAAFLRCWTRKEAYVKALGEGLRLPLDGFTVSLEAGMPAEVLTVEGSQDAAAWSLCHFEPTPEHVGAVALHGPVASLQCWCVPESPG